MQFINQARFWRSLLLEQKRKKFEIFRVQLPLLIWLSALEKPVPTL